MVERQGKTVENDREGMRGVREGDRRSEDRCCGIQQDGEQKAQNKNQPCLQAALPRPTLQICPLHLPRSPQTQG
jgi:hypothetical protein